MKKNLGIYVHIPFCRSKCQYCDFYSLAGAEALMPEYQKALLQHIGEVAPFAAGYTVDTVYFGGGTPSLYGEKNLTKLLSMIQKRFNLDVRAEITLEANPDSADKKELKSLARAGFNRISLGMQSADDDKLKTLGRPHTFGDVRRAVADARDAGFKNLSLDLIYGLPSQTAESWRESLGAALSLRPEHLSCYGLKIEEHTPFFAKQNELDFPDDDLQADMYLSAVETLGKQGFRQYEISNFALPDRESRHNLKYWTGGEYVGLGAAAHSDFGGSRYSYFADLKGYIKGVLDGDAIVAESETLTPRERDGEYIMLRLRTSEGISEKEYFGSFRLDFAPLEELMKSYRDRGWADTDGRRWFFTPRGFLISNRLIGELLDAQSEAKLKTQLPILRHEYGKR
ncbi:radical SAM family heme chaperone HemW [Papillibacter cinnamivorans]|uniref:Heme chaperone HemW n=1 Tax=Papillibacter cinnamivorans DSM 12816 TaxID=1122930 RepID=A0A1W2A6H1_9FIRM|nr:radical SAM family heme chaperone HemW [Papillibacter cinnamivorans]SMC56236.1 oxygen-independent coproporphyrinogen-3 oxidase [Papillibacter cinnamivorans DSM 12816]